LGEGEPGFDEAKAEMFEAVGHPYRIRIIQALGGEGMGFAELKKKVGMESSGHLAFHLGKLRHLVTMNEAGLYTLTGEGREALSMIQAVREGTGARRILVALPTRRTLLALLVILVLALALVAAFQQLQIESMTKPQGTVSLGGRAFWYAVIPLSSMPADRNVSFVFDGVNFTLIPTSVGLVPFRVTGPNSTSWVGTYSLSVTLENATVVPPGRGVSFSLLNYPDIQVRFPDGKSETMSAEHTTSHDNTITYSYSPPAYPWFSVHQNPRVAISENSTSVTLYVSV
jgi:DNA-binding HxlR family transcriptional regulator